MLEHPLPEKHIRLSCSNPYFENKFKAALRTLLGIGGFCSESVIIFILCTISSCIPI